MKTETLIQLPFTTSHAFLIGINDYEGVSTLSTAVNDAEAVGRTLAEDHGYQVYPPLLNATRAEIMQLLEEVPKLVGEDDRVLFYFAGHGIALDSDDNPKGYLVPLDAEPGDRDTLISMDTVHEVVRKLPCRHGLMILDCCFAGAFKWSSGYRDIVFDLPSIIYEERFYQYTRDPAWQVITSSAADQKAVDILSDRTLGMRNEEGEQHSPFARALLAGLAGEADTIPKGTGDGVITTTELYTYLRNRVEDETTEQGKRQSPSMFSLHKHNKGQYIFLHPNHRFNLPPIPRRNPFMGLNSYNEEDAELFYGRDRVTDALYSRVSECPLLVVSGASGTGKSSVIKAGLLGRLRKEEWQLLPIIRPGKEPLENLTYALPDLAALMKGNKPSILVIDQYEELITQCLDPRDRVAFEKKLAACLEKYPQLRIVISVRSDFEPHFESGCLEKWWAQGRYQVPVFSQDEIREVIIKPATQEVLFFEPEGLVDTLVDAVNQAPGALPLLSFTLSELYHAYLSSGRTDRSLTQEDYLRLGGVIGALRTRANAMYDEMDTDHQDSMRKLVLRMVSLEGGETASRRVLYDELIFPAEEETQRIKLVAQQLVDARLVSSGQDKEGQTYYEPAHDALVRSWTRLWEWIRARGERKLRLMYKLHLAVVDYQEKKDKEYLWNDDPRLSLLSPDLHTDKPIFNARETSFLKRSMALKLRNNRRKLISAICIGVTLVGISVVSVFFYVKAERALEKAEQSLTETKIMQEKEANAKYKANFARLRADTLSKGIVASKEKTSQVVFNAVEALSLYEEKSTNPSRFQQEDRLNGLIEGITTYGAQLKILVPTLYEGAGWGYQDALGNVTIFPRYEEARTFDKEGHAIVKLQGDDYQINRSGKIQGAADPLWEWKQLNKGDDIPAHAIAAGFELDGKDTIRLYVGQSSYDNNGQRGMGAGKVKGQELFFPWEGKAICMETFRVLVLSPNYQSVWVDSLLVETYLDHGWRQALIGWKSEEEGLGLQLCRTNYEGQLIPGELFTKACHFTDDNEEKLSSSYEVFLIADQDTPVPSSEELAEAKRKEVVRIKGELTGDDVNVRKSAPKGTPIMSLSTGDEVEILREELPAGETLPWYLIKYNNEQGWIRSDFVKPVG